MVVFSHNPVISLNVKSVCWVTEHSWSHTDLRFCLVSVHLHVRSCFICINNVGCNKDSLLQSTLRQCFVMRDVITVCCLSDRVHHVLRVTEHSRQTRCNWFDFQKLQRTKIITWLTTKMFFLIKLYPGFVMLKVH